jgi:hypothetical protein
MRGRRDKPAPYQPATKSARKRSRHGAPSLGDRSGAAHPIYNATVEEESFSVGGSPVMAHGQLFHLAAARQAMPVAKAISRAISGRE